MFNIEKAHYILEEMVMNGHIVETNKNIVELTMKRQKLYKFDEYLKQDYLKYYK